MKIEIVGRLPKGTCSLSGKKETEVFTIRVGGGDVQQVSTRRLPEVLRMLCSVGDAASSADAGAKPPERRA